MRCVNASFFQSRRLSLLLISGPTYKIKSTDNIAKLLLVCHASGFHSDNTVLRKLTLCHLLIRQPTGYRCISSVKLTWMSHIVYLLTPPNVRLRCKLLMKMVAHWLGYTNFYRVPTPGALRNSLYNHVEKSPVFFTKPMTPYGPPKVTSPDKYDVC